MKRSSGFTVIELASALVLIILLGVLGIVTKNSLDASSRDIQRKTSVNAFYYGLKEGYFKANKSYPATITTKNLPYIDAKLFKDPKGRVVGSPQSDYRYRATDCKDNVCQHFEISADLEKEAQYKKSSRR